MGRYKVEVEIAMLVHNPPRTVTNTATIKSVKLDKIQKMLTDLVSRARKNTRLNTVTISDI